MVTVRVLLAEQASMMRPIKLFWHPISLQNPDAAESLLWVIRQLWSHAYIAPVYALLLHQRLLFAGGVYGAQVSKLLNVLVTGLKQLFSLDVSKGTVRFRHRHNHLQQLCAYACYSIHLPRIHVLMVVAPFNYLEFKRV